MWSYKRKGQGSSQVAIYHKYARACGIGEDERRRFLWQATGCRSSKDRRLTQQDFDLVMILLERRLARMLAEGRIDEGYLRGQRINPGLDYWRQGRNPAGGANTRQRKAMWEAWTELQAYLPEADRTEAWLLGFCAQCTGQSDFWTATLGNAARILDGLRLRIKQGRRHGEDAPMG